MHEMIWFTADGRSYLISQMDTDHIRRCIAMIERKRRWRRQFLERLRLELYIRENNLREGCD